MISHWQFRRSSIPAAVCLIATTCAYAHLHAFPQSVADAATHAERGLSLAQSGNLVQAEAELSRAHELAPDEPDYLTGLGTVLAMQGKLEESTVFFTKALKSKPGDLAAREYLAANLWQLHRPQESRRNLEILLREKPDDRSALLLMGMVSEELKDYSTAAKVLASVPELVRQRPESIAALARAYYHLDETGNARATLEALLGHPAGDRGVFLGARIAAEMRDFGTAIKLYQAIRATYPDPAALGYNLALAQFNDQRVGDARQTLLAVIDTGHPSGDIYDLLGWCYQKRDQTREAVHAFEEAIRLDPSEERDYADLGKVLFDSGSFTAALQTARKAVKLQSGSHDAHMLEAEVEYRLGQFTDATASFARAAQLDPSDPEAKVGLAKAQAATGMTGDAKTTFEEAIKRWPKNPECHLEYGLLLLGFAEAGNATAWTQGEAQLKVALAINSQLPEADYQLGNLALERNHLTVAVDYLQAARKLAPEKSKIHFALARAYRRQGRKEEVAQELTLYQQLKTKEETHASVLWPAGINHD